MSRTSLRILLLGVAFAVLAFTWPSGPGGAEPIGLTVEPAVEGRVSIVWAGDTMLGDGAQPILQERGYDWPMLEVRELLEGDVAVVNVETAITTINDPFIPSKAYSYSSDPEMAQALADAGVDVIGLANNHALDQGPTGLTDTMRYAASAELAAFGAGANEMEAERPLLIRAGDITIGVVGLGKGYGSSITARADQAGTIALSSGSIARGYQLAQAAGADAVVGYVHWGENYRPHMTEQQLGDAEKFAAAGYDLVIGHGPHVHQEAAMVDGMPVFYSLGNFVFGAPGRFTREYPGYGLVLKTDFGRDGLEAISVTCIVTDNDIVAYQPRICDAAASGAVLTGVGVDALSIGG